MSTTEQGRGRAEGAGRRLPAGAIRGRAGFFRAAPLAALAALLLILLPTSAAWAAPSPGEEIADRLRDSPVYVHDAYTGAVDEARQRAITAQIEETGLPIKVVLVPLAKGDDFAGDPGTLAEVVRGRLGDGDLILVTTSEQADWLQGFEWPGDAHQARDAVGAVGHLDEMNEAGLAARVEKAVELIDAGNGTEVYEEAVADLGADTPPATGADDPDAGDEQSEGGSALPLTLAAAAAAVAVLAGLLWYVRRGRTGSRAATAPFATPQAVFAAARTADEAELRRRAEEEVVALGEAVREVETDAPDRAPHVHAALDAYAAAGTVLDGARSRADLAGVLALVAEGRDALEAARATRPRRTAPLPLCFFNPLHGRATHRTRWRPLGSRRQLPVATCDTCTKALRERRAPEVLTDTTDGREVPYFEVPAESSIWAATGYGSLTRDPLAPRVARGDFTRTRD
ncbi:hypothetical protein OG946_14515 [Streptomyces sp. NBC_01808]|uniref:hypothetical protein n=1 Tax=Streptomyces sp. NBC_01808 TaxID=2975947 RepID=UPI002DDC0405|nr:hypothetical protein [Streptomyces sp. NBC_01808]WSA38483.1 hypothetical protein OG946_14515 [Streptomyces sp. NBC_01808]